MSPRVSRRSLHRKTEAQRVRAPSATHNRTLLVPVDGSGPSLRAVAHAASLARVDKRLHLILLNVQIPIKPSLFITRSMIDPHQASQGKAALTSACRLLARRGIVAKFVMRVGDPADVIADTAKRDHCHQIVMGTRGLGRVKGLFLGSITTKVLHLTRTPVIVVP